MYNLIITVFISDLIKNDETRKPLKNGMPAILNQKGVQGKNTSPPFH